MKELFFTSGLLVFVMKSFCLLFFAQKISNYGSNNKDQDTAQDHEQVQLIQFPEQAGIVKDSKR